MRTLFVCRYVIEKKEKLGSRWLKCCKTPDKQSQYKVTDVDEGTEVQFQVRAENEAGVGDPCEPTEIFTIEDPTSKCPRLETCPSEQYKPSESPPLKWLTLAR